MVGEIQQQVAKGTGDFTLASSVSLVPAPQVWGWQTWGRKLGYEEAKDSLQIGQMRNLIRNVPRTHVTLLLLVWLWRGQKVGRCRSQRS